MAGIILFLVQIAHWCCWQIKVYVNCFKTSFTKNNKSKYRLGNQLAQTNGDLTISGTESQTQHFDGYMSHVAL